MKCISSLAARFQACLLTPEAMGFALTFNLTKNLIRSGLKFNHWLKEVIPGAIGGWCPLCLIAPYLYPSPSLSELRNAYLFLQFHSCSFLSFFCEQFVHSSIVGSSDSLLCVDVKLCHLIYPPLLSGLLHLEHSR